MRRPPPRQTGRDDNAEAIEAHSRDLLDALLPVALGGPRFVIAQLGQSRVPAQVVQSIESRMGG